MKERLEQLKGQFWTRLEELKEDIEEMGFFVEELNREYVTVWANEEENEDSSEWVNNPEWVIRLAGTERTIVIKDIEEV